MKLRCPKCQKPLKVGDEFAGKRAKCPFCGVGLKIPELPSGTNCRSSADQRRDIPLSLEPSQPLTDGRTTPGSDMSRDHDPNARRAIIKATCKSCKNEFQVQLPERLVGTSPDAAKPACPECRKTCEVALEEMGCPFCHKGLWICEDLLGYTVPCSACSKPLVLPTEESLKKLREQVGQFKWTVLSSVLAGDIAFANIEELTEAIIDGRVSASDTCMEHMFAPPKTLRDACDAHFTLRKLYDPRKACCSRIANASAGIVGVLLLGVVLIGGLVQFGSAFLLTALLGFLGVLLAATVVGAIVVFMVPALRVATLCFLGVGLCFWCIVGIAYGVPYVIVWVGCSVLGIQKRRLVKW